jgi:hypothetical protein
VLGRSEAEYPHRKTSVKNGIPVAGFIRTKRSLFFKIQDLRDECMSAEDKIEFIKYFRPEYEIKGKNIDECYECVMADRPLPGETGYIPSGFIDAVEMFHKKDFEEYGE